MEVGKALPNNVEIYPESDSENKYTVLKGAILNSMHGDDCSFVYSPIERIRHNFHPTPATATTQRIDINVFCFEHQLVRNKRRIGGSKGFSMGLDLRQKGINAIGIARRSVKGVWAIEWGPTCNTEVEAGDMCLSLEHSPYETQEASKLVPGLAFIGRCGLENLSML